MSSKEELISLFKSCLNILRDNEHLTGSDALNTLSQFLTFKLIQNNINNKIILIDNYDKEILTQEQFNFLKECCIINNLLTQTKVNVKLLIKDIWTFILSRDEKLKNIYNSEENFILKNNSTYIKILTKLNNFDFNNLDIDIQGEAYEEVVKDIMIGKVLGQYFTPPEIKQYMVNQLNPQIGQTIFDPAMGTGGFLITTIRHFIKKAKQSNIKLDWSKLSSTISGREAHEKTHQMAMANMLISTGHIFNLEHGDSIRNPITNKYDIVMANPPFGIKGLNYDEIEDPLKEEYLPIKTKNSIQLFIQAIIYMLEIKGKCGIVLPNGRELYGTDIVSVNIRKFLMKTCKLTKITYMPSGVFTNTSIKTCILFFEKCCEGKDIITKNKKEIIINAENITENVKFYNYNFETKEEELIIDVPISKIVENNYSLNHTDYIKNNVILNTDEIEWKTLGEVCEINQGKSLTKKDIIKGDFPVIGGGKVIGFHNNFNHNANEITITRVGDLTLMFQKTKYFLTDNSFCLSRKIDINIIYMFYYLNFIQNNIKDLYKGTAQKVITKTNLSNIKIQVPSLEVQEKIVEQIDFIHQSNENSKQQINNLKQLNEMFLKTQLKVYDCNEKTLEEVCKVSQGTYLKKYEKIIGNYPVYGGGDINFYLDKYNRENEIIVSKDGISKKCIRYEKNKFFLNHHGWTLECMNIHKKFLFYYLQMIQEQLYNLAQGTAQLGINQKNFYSIKIPVPSLEVQQKIVDYCDFNTNLIEQLQQQVSSNDELINNILTFK